MRRYRYAHMNAHRQTERKAGIAPLPYLHLDLRLFLFIPLCNSITAPPPANKPSKPSTVNLLFSRKRARSQHQSYLPISILHSGSFTNSFCKHHLDKTGLIVQIWIGLGSNCPFILLENIVKRTHRITTKNIKTVSGHNKTDGNVLILLCFVKDVFIIGQWVLGVFFSFSELEIWSCVLKLFSYFCNELWVPQ